METNVYVRDAAYEWLPATVSETSEDDDRVLVRLDIPPDFAETTARKGSWPQNGEERWIELREYHNHTLPAQSPLKICGDVSLLNYIHDAAILYQVKESVLANRPFIRCNRDLLLAINPAMQTELYSPEYQMLYGELQQDQTEEKKEPDASDTIPHIYEVTSKAHRSLVANSRDQVIVAVGESASGKSKTTQTLVNHLVSFGGSDELLEQLRHAAAIFGAFGNATTEKNASSTRFGQICQLEYEHNGLLCGASFQAHMLESTRVTSSTQAGFHIFYQMLNASPQVKARVLGADWEQARPADFVYLEKTVENPGDWAVTAEALEVFGWEGLPLQRLMQALSVTLLLGNVEFKENEGRAVVESLADLNMVALSLGVPATSLEFALTNKRVKGKDGLPFSTPCNIDEATRSCDSLARVLYNCIFSSVVRQINILTSAPPALTGKWRTISFVDMFGFENLEVNQLDTLCVNYANEKLHQQFLTASFNCPEFVEEEIEILDLKPFSNMGSIRLVDGVSGVIKTLREECGRTNATNENFVCKLKLSNESSSHFVSADLQTSFGINHFAGTVMYDATSFVQTAIEKIPEHLLETVAESTNGVISYEISELTKESFASQRKKTKSIVDKFRRQLKELLLCFENREAHFIRCIKTSDEVGKDYVDHSTVTRQLHYSQIVRNVELSRPLFTDTLPVDEVKDRFMSLIPTDKIITINELSISEAMQFILSVLFAPTIEKFRSSTFDMPFICSKSKVFFRAGALKSLNKRVETLRYGVATVLKWWRRYSGALRARKQLVAGKVIVLWLNARRIRSGYVQKRMAARRMTSWGQGRLERMKFSQQRHAATVISAWFMGRRRFLRALDATPDVDTPLQLASSLDAISTELQVVPEDSSTELQAVCSNSEMHQSGIATSAAIDWSCFREDEEDDESETDDTSALCVLVPKTVLHESEQLKKRVVDLNENIVQVTTEAELHNQEIAADYEERLGEYEHEVLELQQQVNETEEEKRALKQQIAANMGNIKTLKDGIRGMQESHREYLNRVMRAIEKANTEHAESLRVLKKDREERVLRLETDLRRLKKRQQVYEMSPAERTDHFYSLARKLEKITSPHYIAAKVSECNKDASLVNTIEQNISSKTRNILYRLEDLAAASRFDHDVESASCIEGLQQRLVTAYEEIEELKSRAPAIENQPTGLKSRKGKGIRSLFESGKSRSQSKGSAIEEGAGSELQACP